MLQNFAKFWKRRIVFSSQFFGGKDWRIIIVSWDILITKNTKQFI